MSQDKEILLGQLNDLRERQLKLKEDLLSMPKGHVNVLYRNGKGYYYLTYRDGKKIRNDYLGPVGKTDLSNVFNKLKIREEYKASIRKLKMVEQELKAKTGRNRKNAA
ncbi:MAG: hypothetical protein IKF80_00225 [Erysipelotrichaceae bacterium]|nr:hypothetical protein [Erysipelotrichaceae bacterium]